MTMKSKRFLWFTMSLLAVILTVPRTASADIRKTIGVG